MFNLVRRTPLKEYNGEGLFYVHQETGMEVFHIKNQDPELTCNFIFATPSEDDKGIAHVIEHTVLCGSKRFPVKDPFSQALLSSPNTFLNAVTFGDKTMFPLSSPLKKDFDNLFDIYANAVFDPLLRLQSFQQEGIRLFDGHFDGVVFNEMCGARNTEDSAVQVNITKNLFRGTPYEFDSGGDPLCIATLSYEEYIERYHKWYSPSNCRLFLFGSLETKEYLDKLEKLYLEGKTKNCKFISKSQDYMQKHLVPFKIKAPCAVKDARSVVLTWLTTASSDPLEVLTVSVLVDVLLGNPGAPLYKAIIDSNLGEDLNPMSGTDPDSPVLTFTVGFSKAKKNKEEEIEKFLIDTISKLAKDGLPKDAVEAAIKRQEFKLQEIPGDGIPFGISTSLKAARTWLRGKDPESGVQDLKRLETLKKRMESGNYLESWMIQNLVNNPRRCLLTVETDPLYEKKFKNALNSKIKMLEKQGKLPTLEDKEKFEKFIETPDDPKLLASIGRISRKDLPLRVPNYKTEHFRSIGGAHLYTLPVFTRGIVYISMAFDTKNLSCEEKRFLPLLVRFLNMCGTQNHSYIQVGTLIKLLTGGFSINTTAGRDVKGNPVSFVIVKAKALKGDLEAVLNLIGDILQKANLSDLSRIKAALTDLLTEFEGGYTYSANSYAVINASSSFSSSAMESEITVGTSCWLYMQEIKKRLDEDNSFSCELQKFLISLYQKIFVQRALTFHIGCEEPSECKETVLSCVESYPKVYNTKALAYFNKNNIKKMGLSGDMEAICAGNRRYLCVSSALAYNALAMKFPRCAQTYEKDLVSAILLASVLSSGYLWSSVRNTNGAYGVDCHVDSMEDLFVFSSYRDPCISETFDEFFKSFSAKLSPKEVEYAVVSIIGRDIKPPTPQMMCAQSFKQILYKASVSLYKKRRKTLLSLTLKDVQKTAKWILKEGSSNAVMTTVCGKDLFEDALGKDFESDTKRNVVLLPI